MFRARHQPSIRLLLSLFHPHLPLNIVQERHPIPLYAATMEDMVPELWANVLFFLYRPLPRARSESTWSDLHQHDLSVAMRVSRVSLAHIQIR
jgi:hypothetical protein